MRRNWIDDTAIVAGVGARGCAPHASTIEHESRRYMAGSDL